MPRKGYQPAILKSYFVPDRLVVIPASMIIAGLESELTESLTLERRLTISDAIDYIKRHSGKEGV